MSQIVDVELDRAVADARRTGIGTYYRDGVVTTVQRGKPTRGDLERTEIRCGILSWDLTYRRGTGLEAVERWFKDHEQEVEAEIARFVEVGAKCPMSCSTYNHH